jgi:hypothetical protein
MKTKVPNYTEAQEATIREAAATGPLNAAAAAALAETLGKTSRSVIAKIIRMGLPYATKEPTGKDGSPVEKKEAIVAEIASVVGLNLAGLEKAPKSVLQRLRDHVAA